MREHRNLKMASLIQEELGKMLIRDFDFDGALVTVTGVEVSEDLLQARIKLGVIPYEKEPAAFVKVDRAKKTLQHQLLKKINTKPMPHLEFVIDQSAKEATAEEEQSAT